MSGSHAGQPSSWLAVVIIFIGFTVGGVALCLGPQWVLFGVGAAITVLGVVVGMAVGIMSDVVMDAPRVIPEATGDGGRRGGSLGETIDKPVRTDAEQTPHG